MRKSTITLDYGALGSRESDDEQKRLNNLSAVVQAGDHLWLASDEDSTIQRLSWAKDRYASARSFDLRDLFDLPQSSRDKKYEIDIEGLSVDGRRLWIAGSHSRGRKKGGKSSEGLKPRGPRGFLGFIELSGDSETPIEGSGAMLPIDDNGNELIACLAEDQRFRPSLDLGDKENGLNIEGLAVRDGRVLLGLRGPLIEGKAVILEIAVQQTKRQLALRTFGEGGAAFRAHLLDLDGLGIRDLAVDDAGLLILAGPNVSAPGPWFVWRWAGAFGDHAEGAVPEKAIERCAELPTGEHDHPEGITTYRHPDGRSGWLVVYDRPSDGRVGDAGTYGADFFPR